jgi:hypothetical protein
MFVRKKRNRSGSTSVQVISKSGGRYRVIKTIRAAGEEQEIARLVELGKLFVKRCGGHRTLFPEEEHDNAVVLDFVQTLQNAAIRTVGPDLIFGRLFDEIGFNAISEQLFRDIVIARLVYPIGYDIFEGNTFEGKTLLPVLRQIQERYKFGKPVVVADAAMLSKENVETLQRDKYPFIVGARIRNETESTQRDILSRCSNLGDGKSVVVTKDDGLRLIVSYSEKRAKKDAHNRERGVKRLQKRVRSGQLTKEHLNNRGYNKFLRLQGEVTIEIDDSKIAEAAKWDGLKGYLTNTKLSASEVVENYRQLWRVEQAFRISKTDLRIRPMYHRRRRRIEAHILIAFVAYTIQKELERRLTKAKIPLSPGRVAELTQTMYEMAVRLPNDPEIRRVLLQMDPNQQQIYDLLY